MSTSMKGAIECADKVMTVSPLAMQARYLTPGTATVWDDLLRQKQYKLCGILNGIDVKSYDPAAIPIFAANRREQFCGEQAQVQKELSRRFSACTIGLFRWWPWSRGWWAQG